MSSEPPVPSPSDRLVEGLQQRVLAAREIIRVYELARWNLFNPKELWLIQKGLQTVVLDQSTGSSVETLQQSQDLLQGLYDHLADRYYLPSKATKPEPPPGEKP
jgi:hypothetical protein